MGRILFHRDNGFDGMYRDNFFRITGQPFELHKQWYYPTVGYGFVQCFKEDGYIKHNTFDLKKGKRSGYHISAKLKVVSCDYLEEITRDKEPHHETV